VHALQARSTSSAPATKKSAQLSRVTADDKTNEPRPSDLQLPSSAIPGGKSVIPGPRRAWQSDKDANSESSVGGGVSTSDSGKAVVQQPTMQGNYAAARRSQGQGALASTPED